MKKFNLDRWIMKNLESDAIFFQEDENGSYARSVQMVSTTMGSIIHIPLILLLFYFFKEKAFLFLPFYLTPFLFNYRPYKNDLELQLFIHDVFPFHYLFRKKLTDFFHKNHTGTELRNKELTAFIDANTKKEETIEDGLVYTDLFQSDVNKFLETHLQLTQSFKRFFLEKMTDGEETNYCKILASLLIPRSKSMPIDHLREIILALKEVPDNRSLAAIKIIKSGRLDELFTNVSNDQIKSIFTRPFDMNKYLDLLTNSISVELNDPKFSPASTLRELIDNAPVTFELREIRLHHKALKNLKIHGFRVHLLLSKNDFVLASQSFRNCVQSYHKDENQDCFVIYKNNTPTACVRVHNNKIVEISGFRNESLSPSLRREINQAFKKVI